VFVPGLKQAFIRGLRAEADRRKHAEIQEKVTVFIIDSGLRFAPYSRWILKSLADPWWASRS
jgi:hypothetical protein